ncbi:MAG: leucine-rich repeat domain-containing protein [Bacteroidaceae bacterium]|nr:leucine-rich repeat domain-containing protein [Bacteroidaceae bacterium]
MDEGVSEIGDGWFNYLNEVREISLPTTLRCIGKSAFASCERLEEVFIPEGVEELAESAFQDCSHVRRFHLPATLRSIGLLALHVGDGHLLSIDVAKQNGHFASSHGVLYNHDKTTILQYPCGKRRKEYTIPASVTTIAEDCFSHARHLEHVILPEGLNAMGSSAFGFCSVSAYS